MTIPYEAGESLTCQQVRELDLLAIEHVGLPGLLLMENAGRSAAEFIFSLLPNPRTAQVTILAGPGNNGGDGLVIARHLRNAGVQVVVVLATAPNLVQGDAWLNLSIYQRLNAPLLRADTTDGLEQARGVIGCADVIVDALLGTGARGAPRGAMAQLVECSNAANAAWRVAIDVPSGLNADSGAVETPCFRADATITFVAEKIGFSTPAARQVLGSVRVADVGVPRELIPGRQNAGRYAL